MEIQESVECKLYEHAQYMQSLLTADMYQSDLEMSNEEQSCCGSLTFWCITINLNYVLDVYVSLLLYSYYVGNTVYG